jgi:regulator of sirC expression with transglutaminase-like and TPR domain
MTLPLSLRTPTSLEFFASLVAEDSGLSLLEAASAVAQDEYPQLDPLEVINQVDELAERLRRRIPADAAALHRLRAMNHYFFEELGFAGNVNNYYDAGNSYLCEVLRTRRGIPITLAILYVELASRVGLDAAGVSFPGHFLIKLHMPRGEVIIDPFSGHSLSRDELDQRLAPYRRQRGLTGDFEAPLGLFLQAAPPRDVIARLLRNLKEIHRSARDWPRLLAVQERLVLLLPQAWDELRDRGLVLAQLGRHVRAIDDLSTYLAQRADAHDAGALTQRLGELRRQSGRSLH